MYCVHHCIDPQIPMHLNLLRNLVIWYASLRAKGIKSWLLVLTITLIFSKNEIHNPTKIFIERILDLGLYPTVSRPTCITKNTATLIDNILISQSMVES